MVRSEGLEHRDSQTQKVFLLSRIQRWPDWRTFTSQEISLSVTLQPKMLSLLTQLCKCWKISQTYWVLSCYIGSRRLSFSRTAWRLVTYSACLLILRQSASKNCNLTGKWASRVQWKLIPKTYVKKSNCPKDWGILMRYLETAIRRKSTFSWLMLPLNDPLPPCSQFNCVWVWYVDYYW